MFSHRLRIGRLLGIDLFVHWSFGLLVAFVLFTGYVQGGGIWSALFLLAQLLTFFLCITLHEYGHSLTARRFGIETVDITLLPIGGAARLRQIPRVPLQEFLVAIAGPAVNVLIAAAIAIVLLVSLGSTQLLAYLGAALGLADEATIQAVNDVLSKPSWVSFLLFLFAVNIALVLFNLLPAFPMDGGRVLRSLMAMMMPYLQATRWAQRVGLVCACAMAWAAITSEPPQVIVLAIAAYVCYAGLSETKQVELGERLQGLSVGDVMVNRCDSVAHDLDSNLLIAWWQHHTIVNLAVTGLEQRLLGIVPLSALVNRRTELAQGKLMEPHAWPCTAADLIDHNLAPLMVNEPLESAWGSLQRHAELPVVNDQYQVVGWLNARSVLLRADMARMQGKPSADPSVNHPPTDYLFAL